MSKLPIESQFFDLSDYGRPLAKKIVKLLLPTCIGSITLTWVFTIIGISSAFLIYHRKWLIFASILLIIKSVIDAADGEMARTRNRPSYTGRYLDSINDFIINGFILFAIGLPLDISIWTILIGWFFFQLHGTIFSFFYVIKRHDDKGDTTSRINELSPPNPYEYENAKVVRILHQVFLLLYGWQDKLIEFIDNLITTHKKQAISNKFMTAVSLFGLGTQLMFISIFVSFNLLEWIFPIILIIYNVAAFILFLIRRYKLL